MHPDTEDACIKEQKKCSPQKVCAVCVCECVFTHICALYQKKKKNGNLYDFLQAFSLILNTTELNTGFSSLASFVFLQVTR